LLQTCEEGRGKEELKTSLDFLTNYTIKRFFEEEELQKKYNYPDYQNHRQYHEGFKASVRELSHRLIMSGATEDLIQEVQKQIGQWLVTHIQVQDKKLAAYIKAHGV
jgi:hemerythrin